MAILLTGAAGFIGFHLSKRLLIDGYDLIGIDDINNYYDPNLKKDRLTTRDSRFVERKKYGHRKARRSFQFSKR